MKLKFTIHDLRFAIWKKSAKPAPCHAHPPILNQPSQRGVALIITLILMSVTLVMALAFLAISNRERASVTTTTDSANARLAADAALSAAEVQIVANALAGGGNALGGAAANPYGCGMLVSTNFINGFGFQSGISSTTNVNYNYPNGNPVYANPIPQDFLQNLANLEFMPRPPVFIPQNGTNDFRFYLDLNRNGQFEDSGMVPLLVTNGINLITNANPSSIFETGDPQWIGLLQHPDQPYGPNNKFIARFAFAAVPIGNALDLNYIHNQSLIPTRGYPTAMNMSDDAYFRNQGVGTWEMNLAAFLTDLNTNQWDPASDAYAYQQPLNPYFANVGRGFEDAFSLLAYRYSYNYNSQTTANSLFNGLQNYPLNIDSYSDGGLQTTFNTNYLAGTYDNLAWSWAGADNTNHFYELSSDLFDSTKTTYGVSAANIANGNDFPGRLSSAGSGGATYDRYTFYRLLSQLGTDSQPESGKMNLNYDNLDANGNVIPGAETNLISWTTEPNGALKFFTNAADRMLRAYTARWATNYTVDQDNTSPLFNTFTNGLNTNFVAMFCVTNSFGITNIPVLVSNRFVYSSAVNRLLQLAANLYDATSTNPYPTIFRPLFSRNDDSLRGGAGMGTNVFITGFTQLDPNHQFSEGQELLDPNLAMPIEISTLAATNVAVNNALVNVYGVPWIIGAKKGFPNFNEFAMANSFSLIRKLELIRNTNTSPPTITQTNQMYLMTFTNYYGIELWNSYRSNYLGYGAAKPGALDIFCRCTSLMLLTNDDNFYAYLGVGGYPNANGFTNIWNFTGGQNNSWPGWNGASTNSSLQVPLNVAVGWFTNVAAYAYNDPHPANSSQFTYNTNYWDKGIQNLPRFGLLTTNRLQVAIIDFSAGNNNGRIVDYVQLGGMDDSLSLNSFLSENDNNGNGYWNTNLYNNGSTANYGVFNQIQTSEDPQKAQPPGIWNGAGVPNGDVTPDAQAAFFRGFFAQNSQYDYTNSAGTLFTYTNLETSVQAPYTPSASGYESMSWQANDPLVHYLTSDLALRRESTNSTTVMWPDNLGQVNSRYMPWGTPWPQQYGQAQINSDPYDLAYKDPLVRWSDNWDFPTNKFPSIGWLGRIHRGTPWQTVYLKSKDVLGETNQFGPIGANTWAAWTGDAAQAPDGEYLDAVNESPTQDRMLFDLFTAALNDNATRGQLSVNVGANNPDSQAGLPAWSALFSGVTVLSNNLPDVLAARGYTRGQTTVPTGYSPSYSVTNIQPAGPQGASSPLGQLVAGINSTRATFTNADGTVGVFEHTGDILATPQLSDVFPYLKTWTNGPNGLTPDTAQLTNGISDEMYEWLPQQVMGLLRVSGAPRYVVYCYGQTLKPAPNGIYTGGGNFFGMITNYQITAESATRVVLRIDGLVDSVTGRPLPPGQQHPHAVIESFNTLPPD